MYLEEWCEQLGGKITSPSTQSVGPTIWLLYCKPDGSLMQAGENSCLQRSEKCLFRAMMVLGSMSSQQNKSPLNQPYSLCMAGYNRTGSLISWSL